MEQSPSWEANSTLSQSRNPPAFYRTRRFITVFTRVRHLSLSWSRLIKSTPSNPIYLRSILTLSSHLRLGLPSASFLQALHLVQCWFLRWGVVSPPSNSWAGQPPLVGYPWLLIQYICSYPPCVEASASSAVWGVEYQLLEKNSMLWSCALWHAVLSQCTIIQ
jgi:hypothetical protein